MVGACGFFISHEQFARDDDRPISLWIDPARWTLPEHKGYNDLSLKMSVTFSAGKLQVGVPWLTIELDVQGEVKKVRLTEK